MRKEDYAERTTHADSPFKRFNVACLRCQSVKLKVIGEFDTASGEMKIYLVCPSCQTRELMPVR